MLLALGVWPSSLWSRKVTYILGIRFVYPEIVHPVERLFILTYGSHLPEVTMSFQTIGFLMAIT